ncbi:hypothetical protein BJV82DRAFT_610817 [Fennellomyces sp. T-0311]|nr:hypothetical protein BJV82DRAFT_610817 [Fennellomyces sp. T-0311]
MTGYALVPDVEFARQLFTRAADMGYAPSQYRLAVAYETGNLDLPADHRLALMWAQKAAFQGIPDAQFLMSCWHLRGTMDGVPQSHDLACRWAKQAAQNGHTRAMFALACFYEFGIGTEKDRAIADKWLHAAAANKDKLAVQRIRELKAASRKDKKRCNIM